jgi:hypothetical protein
MLGRPNAEVRRRRLLAWLGICLFALRSLVPIGFMVSAGASGAAVILCPDYAPVPPSAAALQAHHHHHHHHVQPDGAPSTSPGSVDLPGAEDHGLCPFAAAAHTTCHGVKPPLAPAVSDARPPFDPAASEAAASRLLLVTSRSPRGPPLPLLG